MKTKLKKWKTLSSKVVFKNHYFTLYDDLVKLPTNEKYHYYLTNKKGKAAMVLPIDSNGNILLAKEYRYPVGRVIYGMVGGGVDKAETPLRAVKREMKEETGLRAKKVTLLGKFYGNPGRSGTIFYIYLAQGLINGVPKREQSEFLEYEFCSSRKIEQLIQKGKIVDPFLLSAFLLYKLRVKSNNNS